MNNDMMRRMMYRDQARRNRQGNRDMYGMGYDRSVQNRYEPRGFDSREPDYRYNDRTYHEPDYARYGNDVMYDRGYVGNYSMPFEVAGRVGRQYMTPDYAMDYHESGAKLSEHELKEWSARLLQSIEGPQKAMFEKERILRRAEELGMRFDKYSKEEFYVAVLMMYTDYCKTLGMSNVDTYLKLAKDWLCDDDIAVKYSEKLAVYHDHIVEGA